MRWAIVVMLLAAPVWADSADQARQHFQKGTTYYDLGQYRDAAREYEEAYKAKSDPALLFNIGQAYRAAGDAAAAIRSYKAFLRRSPDAKNRDEVESQIAKLQRILDDQQVPVHPAPVEPAPTTTAPPPATVAPTPAPAATTVTAAPATPERTPVYKKWWLWTAIGGVVVAGLAVGLAVAYTTPNDAAGPPGTIALRF